MAVTVLVGERSPHRLIAVEKANGNLLRYGSLRTVWFDNYSIIGTGWNGFTKISSGELNRDTYADLIAVETATGRLWMYPGTADGKFSARTEIGSGWNGYTELTLGKFNRDAHDDVMAVNSVTGEVKLHPGTAAGGRFGTPSTIGIGS